MTSISIDFRYQSILIGRLNRLISDIDFYRLTTSGVRVINYCLYGNKNRIAHVRYKILTWLRGFRVKIANFLRLHCVVITRRELNTKKTKPKYRKMTKKPRTFVRILIYRTWAIVLFRLLRNLTNISRSIWHNVNLRFTIRHLYICHNAPRPPPPKKLQNLCFSFLLTIAAVPRLIKNNASAK